MEWRKNNFDENKIFVSFGMKFKHSTCVVFLEKSIETVRFYSKGCSDDGF